MKPVLYAPNEVLFNHNGIGVLSDCVSCAVTEEANGEYELKMKYPPDGVHADQIVGRSIIKVKPNQISRPQLFRVYSCTTTLGGNISVLASHISYDLSGVPVSRFEAENIQEAFQGLHDNAVTECPFTFLTDKNTISKFSVKVPASIRSMLGGVSGSILDVYSGEFEFDNFSVILHNHRGADRGVSIRYGKNLIDYKQESEFDNIYTAIYPYWVNAETGEVVELPEKVVRADGEFYFERIRPYDMSERFEVAPTEEELREEAQRYVKNNDIAVPKVSMSVSFAQLENSEEYKDMALLERVSLFDTVHVFFPQLNVKASAKAVKVVYDCLLERVESVTLGRVRSNIADTISQQMTAIENAPTKSDVRRAQEVATAWLTNGKGYKVERRDDSGRVIDTLYLDTPDINTAVNVLRIGQSGIGFSQSGVDGPYFSAWTLDGHFNADFIRTGTLVSADGTVKVNLATGQVTIDGEREGFVGEESKMFKTRLVLDHSGVNGYGENEEGMMEHTLEIGVGVNGNPTGFGNPSWQYNTGMTIAPDSGEFVLGTSTVATQIYGSSVSIRSLMLEDGTPISPLKIQGKEVRWMQDADGSYILKGYDEVTQNGN